MAKGSTKNVMIKNNAGHQIISVQKQCNNIRSFKFSSFRWIKAVPTL